ncbi:MAG: TraR/DksA C4-type zinc finger protein [Caldilineae bacterium]|nr:TraR/DksA C4-type zinc finger protein [Chloroflexota bacterium]MCB9177001.1 TraR/DksA C4-type zinc finger protein [Caldilineae bacterium]
MPTHRTRRIVEILKQELVEARKELEDYQAQAEQPDFEMGDAEGYSTWQAAVALQGHLEQEVEEIERALDRAEQGLYGTCEACGEAIGAARLHALPYTTLCVRCAAKTA